MGYTHYWNPTGNFTKTHFRALQSAVEKIVLTASLEPWSIGIDLMREDDGSIILNGTPEEESHEDLYLTSNSSFRLCKTARKPYDTVVVACLLAAETIAIDNYFHMKLSSDGHIDDWHDGRTLYETAFPGRLEKYVIYIGEEELKHGKESINEDQHISSSALTKSLGDTPQSEPCLRIWWDSPKEDGKTFYQEVLSPEDAGLALQTLTAYDKSQFGYSGSGGLQLLNSVGHWLKAEVEKED